ncbi:MAG TPA: hypothetical protein VKF59_10480 [Candidatus Dormibacteraeota bacterium]|nr:hypothetical protein [Candidatus Dormibacteraeota bacterium]
MDHVLWLGGGCGSGKSSIARELTHRLDLRLYAVDAHGYDHHRRLGGQDLGGHDERWLLPTPEQLADRFVRESEERLTLIFDDLTAMREGPLVLAEGAQLFPELVAAHLASPGHGLWLVPTDEFQRRALGQRAAPQATSDAERAGRNRLARDSMLNALIRRQASDIGLTVIEVDGSRTLLEMMEAVQSHFAEHIAAGPRARDGAERRRIRREENESVHSNLASYQADVGMAQAPIFDFACECVTLGCRERVRLSIDEYGTTLAQPDRFVVVPDHLTEMDP